jgi:hypothetical protein
MRKKFRITLDTNKEAAMIVHLPNKTVKFKEWPNGLYAMNPAEPDGSNSITPSNYQMIQTIEENKKFLSPRQQGRARKARELYHATGTPTVDDLKAMIQMNLIKNNQVTTEDVNLATRMYGPDIGTVKGKTTRSRPTPVTSNLVEIPDELLEVQKDVTISIDGMTVNSQVSHYNFARAILSNCSICASQRSVRVRERHG